MENQKLTVVARAKAKPGKEAEVRQALHNLLAPTRDEEGCINYDMHESVDTPGQFMFHENWTSRAALDRHIATAHVQNFFGRAEELLAEPVEITFWKQVG